MCLAEVYLSYQCEIVMFSRDTLHNNMIYCITLPGALPISNKTAMAVVQKLSLNCHNS